MRSLQQSTAYALMVFMTDSADHIAGKTGLTLAVTASKAGAAFASISPTVTERGNGWYAVDLTSSHTDTAGDFALHISATGADPSDLNCQVMPFITDIPSIKAKTDSLTFTAPGQVDANIQYVNDVQVKGVGSDADPWNPA
jgi:hypothetical protein